MPTVEDFARAVTFARGEAGDPYVWGGDGCDGWDCSGYMGGILNVLYGRQVCNNRQFGTGTIDSVYAAIGFRAGAGGAVDFTIGVIFPWESASGIGHTAGTIDGLNVEARGGRGVLVGAEARGANDPLFRHHYHVPLEEDELVGAREDILAAIADMRGARGLDITQAVEKVEKTYNQVNTKAGEVVNKVSAAETALSVLIAGLETRVLAAIAAIPTGPGGGITPEQAVEAVKTALREGTV
jgi:hypothetical protein